MHPLGWGVNRLVLLRRFGWNSYFTSPSLFSEATGRDVSRLRTPDFRPLMTNCDLDALSPWADYLERVHFDYNTGTASVHVRDETQPLAAPAVGSMVAALDYVAELNEHSGCFQIDDHFDERSGGDQLDLDSSCPDPSSRCWSTIVLFNEPNNEIYEACLEAALAHPHPPLVFYYINENSDEYFKPKIMNDSTVVFHHADDTDNLSHLRLELGPYDSNKRRSIENMTFHEIDLTDLPPELMDDIYLEDKIYLRELADQAIENDPVIGTSGFMPFTRVGNWRMCMGGELSY